MAAETAPDEWRRLSVFDDGWVELPGFARSEQDVRVEFDYDGGGLGKGATVTLHAGGDQIGEGRVEKTLPFQFSFDETADVGIDTASPVSPEYQASGNGFNGTIKWVQIDLGDDDHDHLISPEHKLQVAMLKQ